MTTNTSVDGLYLNATLPFAVTTSVPDGGTDAPADVGRAAANLDGAVRAAVGSVYGPSHPAAFVT